MKECLQISTRFPQFAEAKRENERYPWLWPKATGHIVSSPPCFLLYSVLCTIRLYSITLIHDISLHRLIPEFEQGYRQMLLALLLGVASGSHPMGRMRQALWNREFPSKAHAVGWPGATLGATLPEIVAWLLRLAPQSNRKDSIHWIRVTLYLLCKMDKREKRKAQTFPFRVGSAHACSAGNALATMQTSKSNILSPKLASTRPRSGDRDETRSAPVGIYSIHKRLKI